jgi:hypothetical protein
MAGLGQLTIRFTSGESWSLPFVKDQARQLADALETVGDGQRWVTLEGPDEDDSEQILIARCGTMESVLWVESAGMMQESAAGELGEDFAASDD